VSAAAAKKARKAYPKKPQVTVILGPDEEKRLAELVRREELPVAAIFRRALKAYARAQGIA